MVVNPQIVNIRNSGGPKSRMACRMTGISKMRMITPNVDPSADAVAEQARAVFAFPCWVRGYPSSNVAALEACPGILKRIDVTEPINVAPPTNAPKMSITGKGDQENVRGIARAINVAPFKPGKREKYIDSSVPIIG